MGGRGRGHYVLPSICSEEVTKSDHFACAIDYFAGGFPCDIAVLFKTSYSMVLSCVWIIARGMNLRERLFHFMPRFSGRTEDNCSRIPKSKHTWNE